MKINKYGLVFKSNKQCRLVKEQELFYDKELIFDMPQNVVQIMRDVFELDKQVEEYAMLLCLLGAKKLLGVFELSHGTHNATFVDNKAIFTRALMVNASNIIVVHNHPNGDPTPSSQDMVTCQKTKEVADLMNIPLLDSIIVGDVEYTSFKERGLL